MKKRHELVKCGTTEPIEGRLRAFCPECLLVMEDRTYPQGTKEYFCDGRSISRTCLRTLHPE
jgi:hypothetical protein